MFRWSGVIRFCLAATLLVAPAAFAQQPEMPGPVPPTAGEGQPLGPGEVQRLFDAYTLMEAQDALKLSEAQYGQFVTRMKGLQDVRRRNQQARMEILRELGRLTRENAAPDEAAVRDRLKALRDQDTRMAADLQKAYAALDEVLDVRQQARFRLFEENMERKKLDLLMRARQRRVPLQNRPQQRPR